MRGNMKIRHSISLVILSICLMLLLASCAAAPKEGPAGPAGPAGPQGEHGKQGPAGPAGPAGKDLAVPPGPDFVMKIVKVDLPDASRPVVTVSLTDGKGVAVSPESLEGYGFTIAQVVEDHLTHLTRYQSLLVRQVEGRPYVWKDQSMQPAMASATQAYADTGGTWADLGDGNLTYTFKDQLTAPADPNLMTVVGLYAWKNNRQIVQNDVYSFVQGGVNEIPERQVVTNTACDLCHNPLEAHGGVRRSVALCDTCHTDQTIDPETGNNLSLKVMVHRLHLGKGLPSVQAGTPFQIVGFQQRVFDFSKDVWPQDLRYCITCHTGSKQSDNFKTRPNTEACTSCHDTTNLSTGENHPGGKQTDSTCAACHQPDGMEFDASVTGAHTIPTSSKAVVDIKLDIISVEGAAPGSAPVLKFKVTNSKGEVVDPTKMPYLAVTLAGPTSDYANRWTETIAIANATEPPALTEEGDGVYVYSFKTVLPEDVAGTYAVGMEGYLMQRVIPDKDPVRIAAANPVMYVPIAGVQPKPRRMVVDQTKCNICHMNLEAHGTIRQNVEYCVLCHNALGTDEERRPSSAMPPASINFPALIHGIHNGRESAQPVKVYGYGDQLYDYSELVFPGKLDDCQTCHLPGTYGIPLAKDVRATVIRQNGNMVRTLQPARAACGSCHDSAETTGHIEMQTTPKGVETCTVCHGPNREFDVRNAHR